MIKQVVCKHILILLLIVFLRIATFKTQTVLSFWIVETVNLFFEAFKISGLVDTPLTQLCKMNPIYAEKARSLDSVYGAVKRMQGHIESLREGSDGCETIIVWKK